MIGATGLLPIERLPLEFEDELTHSISVVGFAEEALQALGPPDAETLERSPLRLAAEGAALLPPPELYRRGVLEVGRTVLTDREAPPLTAEWVSARCPQPQPQRVERVSDAAQLLHVTRLDASEALLVAVTSTTTELFRADMQRSERLTPPGFEGEGAARYPSSAAHFEDGRLWLASHPTDGITRIWAGALDSGLELVATSTQSGRIGWLAPDRQEEGALWILAGDGVLFRLSPGEAGWERFASLPAGVAGRGGVAREPDGSLLVLYREFRNRDIARIRRDRTVEFIARSGRERPVYLVETEPHPTFLAHDGITTFIVEVRGQQLVRLAGAEAGVNTVEPLTLAKFQRGFAISGIQGFLLLFRDGDFCPATSGTLGPDTVEHIVDLEGGLLSGAGVLRTPTGTAEITRVVFE